MKNGIWVEPAVVDCTAWFLEMDLMIISEDNDDSQCVTMRYGNLDGIVDPNRPTLYLGFASNHYQSLLPVKVIEDDLEILIPSKCPACGKSSTRILQHMNMSKACRQIIGEEMLAKFRNQSRKQSKLKAKARYSASGKKAETQSKYVKSGRHAQVQAKHWEEKKSKNEAECLESHRKWQRKYKILKDVNYRSRNFLEATKYGPIFICICCNRKISRGNVTPFTEDLKNKHHSFIFDLFVFTNIIEFKDGKEVTPNSR